MGQKNTVARRLTGVMIKDEYNAGAVIKPGFLCEIYNNAGSLNVRAESAGDKTALVAMENDIIGDDIMNDEYTAGNLC